MTDEEAGGNLKSPLHRGLGGGRIHRSRGLR